MDNMIITLVGTIVLLLISAIIYFILYRKITSINPSYNFIQYLQGDQ